MEVEKEVQSMDYKTMPLEALTAKFKQNIEEQAIQDVKEEADAIRASFYYQYNIQVAKAKEDFIAAGNDEIDFEYAQPIQAEFKKLWKLYLDKKSTHYKKIAEELSSNLSKRQAVIDAIKTLVEQAEVSGKYKEFQQLQADWKEIGGIPSDKYQETWGNYHLYVEQFYDLLHLNNDLRAIDFKHNLEAKQQIISKAKELLVHADIQFAFNELQVLHKIWKEETGPVAKEYREPIWQEFSEVSHAIHDKRTLFLNKLKEAEEQNYHKKLAEINNIKAFDFSKNKNFGDWKKSIDDFETLKETFLAIGKVPKNKNKQVWDAFKEATKAFNQAKNEFFKETKNIQNKAVLQKKALIQEALDWKNSDDFEAATDAFKRIQAAWKKTGFVPRKQADALWNEFKTVCDAYFERLHTIKKEGTPEQQENYQQKMVFLESLATKQLSEDTYKTIVKDWISLGTVPPQKNKIDQEIYQAISKALVFAKDKPNADMVKYELQLAYWKSIDSKKIQDEHYELRKKVDLATKDLKQLENNLGFFANSKKGNPLLDTVMQSVEKEKVKLDLANKKMKLLKSFY